MTLPAASQIQLTRSADARWLTQTKSIPVQQSSNRPACFTRRRHRSARRSVVNIRTCSSMISTIAWCSTVWGTTFRALNRITRSRNLVVHYRKLRCRVGVSVHGGSQVCCEARTTLIRITSLYSGNSAAAACCLSGPQRSAEKCRIPEHARSRLAPECHSVRLSERKARSTIPG